MVPPDRLYAATQLAGLLGTSNRDRVRRLAPGVRLGIDLARVELYGDYWRGVDFSWLHAKYLAYVDLRGADLRDSDWGRAGLYRARLQCANLAGARLNGEDPTDRTFVGADLREAQLQGANLENADLRNADLTGADLTGAHASGANTDGAKGYLKPSPPSAMYNRDACLTTLHAAGG